MKFKNVWRPCVFRMAWKTQYNGSGEASQLENVTILYRPRKTKTVFFKEVNLS
jgi:hypothetical protein